MRVWIDLAGPPQVQFFRPVIKALEQEAHEVLITLRDFSGAAVIARQFGFAHCIVGRHGGQSTASKGLAILQRVAHLSRIARAFRPQVAVSHNSYAQALAATYLRVPFVTAMDFEHQPANHISFRLARRVVVPQPFPAAALRRFGATPGRVVRYPGVKEAMYLADFRADPEFLVRLDLPPDRVIVTLRPPARSAVYHRFDNPLFDQALERVCRDPGVCAVLVARTADWPASPTLRVVSPDRAVDGPNLVFWSDVVIGAGGTMTREAAVLGTPSYTLYAGQPIAVDDYLIAQGRLQRVSSPNDVLRIDLKKKQHVQPLLNRAGLHILVDAVRQSARPD